MMAGFEAYITLFLIWLVSTILIRAVFPKRRARFHLPPSPLALPIIGHLHLLGPSSHQALHKIANRYGPLIHLFLGSVPCVVASSPEMAKEFLKTHETSFSNRPKIAAIDFLSYGSSNFIFAPYGPYWKFMKKLCMSELLSGRRLDQFYHIRCGEIKRFIQLIMKKAEAGEEIDVRGELTRMANNVISSMTMTRRCSDSENEADEVRKLIHETVVLSGKFNLSDFIWFCKNLDLQGFGKRLKEVRDSFDTMMEKIMREHEEARKKEMGGGGGRDAVKDLLDILLDISEDESSEIKLTREHIKAFILDIFAAGTDTSSITTEWALAELINHPYIMEKARQEIDYVVGKSRLVEESDIVNLPYLQAIAKETLRLHPAVPLIPRESSKDCTIEGYDIPAGTRLYVNVWAIGRDPNHWENPLEFRPERFVNGDGTLKSQCDVRGQYFCLLPFGSGRRACPGTSRALQVFQTTLAAMIQCFEWKVSDGGSGTVNMEEGVGLTVPRARPLICVPEARFHLLP